MGGGAIKCGNHIPFADPLHPPPGTLSGFVLTSTYLQKTD